MYEPEAREILAGKRASVLVDIVEGAWAQMVAEKRTRRKRTRANIVNDYMAELADEQFEPLSGVHKIERHGMPIYVCDERLGLRFKMHDRTMLVGNVPTLFQRKLASQALALDGMSDVTWVNCGYQLDRAEADIRLVVVTKPMGRSKNEWVIDLREIAEGEAGGSGTSPLPIAPTGIPSLPTVVPPAEEEGGTRNP